MKKRLMQSSKMRIWIGICLSVMLSACTMAPRVANHDYSYQTRLESVDQWQKLAQTVVETQLIPSIPTGVDPDLCRVYVDESDKTEFGKAFRGYLLTELVRHGILDSKSHENSHVVKWGTQLVHNDKTTWMPGVLLGVAEAVGFLVAGSSVILPPNSTELIITTQVNRDYMVLTRETHNYYLDKSSKWNFWDPTNNRNRFARM